MNAKTKGIAALFVLLMLVLILRPYSVNNMYSSVLGRIILIMVVIFFAMNNATLGLLVALAIISASNQFGSFVEGMTNEEKMQTPGTIGDDTGKNSIPNKGAIDVVTTTIRPKSSKTIPIGPDAMRSEEVDANKPSTSLTENFASNAAQLY